MQSTDAIAVLMSAGYDPTSAQSILDRAQSTGAAIARGFQVQYTSGRGFRVARPKRSRARARR